MSDTAVPLAILGIYLGIMIGHAIHSIGTIPACDEPITWWIVPTVAITMLAPAIIGWTAGRASKP